MGFFKKIFKPVSKGLDKIIPNEIKPALPYAAAFAPFLLGPGAASGSAFQKLLFNPTTRAGIMAGLNVGGQLSQEGSEGDINLLSTGLAALSGFGTAGGANQFLEGLRPASNLMDFAPQSAGDAFRNRLISGAQKGVDFLQSSQSVLRPGGEPLGIVSGAKAAALPAATATGDLMQAEARQLEKQAAIDEALAAAEALADAGMRGDAIRNAMRSYGFFSDEEIEDTVSSAGYRAGGRVGFEMGGLGALGGAMAPEKSKYITRKSDTSETDTINRIYEEQGSDGLNAFLERNPDLKDKYVIVADSMSGELTIMENKLHPDFMDMENIIDMSSMFEEKKAKGGRVGFKFGGIDKAIEGVSEEMLEEGKEGIMMAAKEDPLLVEEYNKYVFDLLEQRPEAKPMSFSDFKRMIKSGMKDGGLMDLGGKEMDLRKGGFVPIGEKERADDVPARLSKNEFVMTADAVRGAGGGDINKGAKRMYETMNTLEARA